MPPPTGPADQCCDNLIKGTPTPSARSTP
jgi:hypothetical protein